MMVQSCFSNERNVGWNRRTRGLSTGSVIH